MVNCTIWRNFLMQASKKFVCYTNQKNSLNENLQNYLIFPNLKYGILSITNNEQISLKRQFAWNQKGLVLPFVVVERVLKDRVVDRSFETPYRFYAVSQRIGD